MKQDYNVLIFNSSPIVSEGLEMILKQEEGFNVSGIADDRATALELARESEADIAIVDISIHYPGNIGIIDDIKKVNPDLSILVLSAYDGAPYASRCIRAGAKGYMMLNESREQLIDAIRKVAEGGNYLSEILQEQVVNYLLNQPELIDSLSNREFEVYTLFGKGYTNKEIAEKMGINPKTVSTHLSKITKKLGLNDTRQLLIYAVPDCMMEHDAE